MMAVITPGALLLMVRRTSFDIPMSLRSGVMSGVMSGVVRGAVRGDCSHNHLITNNVNARSGVVMGNFQVQF